MFFLPRFYLILATTILVALSSHWLDHGLMLSIGLALMLNGAVLIDFLLTPREALRAQRRVEAVQQQAHIFSVTLELTNTTDQSALFQFIDSPPHQFLPTTEIVELRIPPHTTLQHSYSLKSFTRGHFAFGPLHYRIQGPLALIQRQAKIDLPQPIDVLPDLSGEGSNDLSLSLAGAAQVGQRSSWQRGEGREFESLRDYQRDDDFRHIDWKASAKRGKLICRHYESERDQRLMILIDTGRLMSPKIGSYNKLDYAINAVVHLAQIALQKGDLIGYGLFNDEIIAYAEPKKGKAQLSHLVQTLARAQPTRLESNYAKIFHHVLKRSSRRTMVVCFTDLTDSFSAQSLTQAARLLLPRHLPVMITVSNSEILGVLKESPKNEFQVYRHVAASEVWTGYQKTLRALHSHGLASVSVPAQSLSVATINEYLRIKETARL